MSDEKTIIADARNLTVLRGTGNKRACMLQYNGAKLGKRYPLSEGVAVIGRSPETQVSIAEPSVSRQHARLSQSGEQWEIEDLGSANGTFVNDQKVESRRFLRDGDMIRLGTILLKFFADDTLESVMADKIYRNSTIDAGTQIFNKQYLIDTLESEFRLARMYQKPLSVIYYDLDFFKKVNDTFGHQAGDIILKESAHLIKASVRKEDVQGRFGGEEFVIVLPNTDLVIACELAERLRIQVAQHEFLLDIETASQRQTITHHQTISIGVAQLDPSMKNFEELLETADKKLYQSKQTGRNKVTS